MNDAERSLRAVRWLIASCSLLVAGLVAQTPGATAATPPAISANADWLTTVNYYRAMAGVAPVSDVPEWSVGALHHSQYMLRYGALSHDETNGAAGWTADGDLAAQNSNVAAHSVAATTDREHIEQWMTGPFHAIGILRPKLTRTGYGHAFDASASPYRSTATLDVIRGIDNAATRPAVPIVFPGNGASTSLDRFSPESPDPRSFCGWGNATVGLPLIAMFPTASGTASSSLVGPGGAVGTCTLTTANTSGTAQAIMQSENAVVVLPTGVLTPGLYTATVTTAAAGSVTWSFVIDPSVADSVSYPATLASTSATASAAGFDPVTPVRVVDTRRALGSRRLAAATPTRLQIAGQAGLPSDATSVSVNLTVVNAAGGGYLTVYPCNGAVPEVSAVNFGDGRPVPNAATVPLDATGGLCAISTVSADLIVDVNGVFRSSGATRYNALAPTRILDTRTGAGGSTRLGANSSIEVAIRNHGGVPSSATAVALNLTAVSAGGEGYITAYPCGALPEASNVNVVAGGTRPNLTIVPLSSRGTVCLFSNVATDLLLDAAGAFVPSSGRQFTPLQPLRLLDTRSLDTRVNANSFGGRMRAGQTIDVEVAGQRGVPQNAVAASLNLTSTGSSGGGGYLTAYPCGALPEVSNVNYSGSDIANAAQVTLDSRGHLCLYASVDTWVIADISGVWT